MKSNQPVIQFEDAEHLEDYLTSKSLSGGAWHATIVFGKTLSITRADRPSEFSDDILCESLLSGYAGVFWKGAKYKPTQKTRIREQNRGLGRE